MDWYLLTLNAAQVAEGRATQCKEAFEELFVSAGGPRAMALFQRESKEGGVDLFFTPDCGKYAAELLDEWQCAPCEHPLLLGLRLLVGHNEITYYMP